jgi:4-hydroxy-tetrahydrodipicolinate reductase
MTIKVGVVGAAGGMGTAACTAVEAAEDLELVASIRRGDDLAAVLSTVRPDVVVDLTHPDAVLATVQACTVAGVHLVIGTSGISGDRLEAVRAAAAEDRSVGVLVVPNFSIGAVLMMQMAAQAAPYFTSVEIVELHRAGKPDAPSGTANRTAEVIAAAREAAGTGPSPDETTHAADGARGASVDGVRVHSVRLAGLLAHQEVLLGNEGEVLTIRHDSLNRSSFMPGVLASIRWIGSHPGLAVGLDRVLRIT